MISLLSN